MPLAFDEEEAVTEYYLQMHENLIAYAFSSLGDYSAAEEAVQETFRIAWMRYSEFLSSDNPRGWLVNTLKNVMSNHRKHQVIVDRLFSDAGTLSAIFPTASHDTVDVDILYSDLSATEEFRMVRQMVLEGKTYSELAKERHISVATCRKQFQRAREKLKKKIER